MTSYPKGHKEICECGHHKKHHNYLDRDRKVVCKFVSCECKKFKATNHSPLLKESPQGVYKKSVKCSSEGTQNHTRQTKPKTSENKVDGDGNSLSVVKEQNPTSFDRHKPAEKPLSET